MKYAVSLDDDGDREGRATPAGEATLEMLSRRVWALAQMDPTTVADILGGDEGVRVRGRFDLDPFALGVGFFNDFTTP